MNEIEQLREGMSKAYARPGDGFVNCAIEARRFACEFAAEELTKLLVPTDYFVNHPIHFRELIQARIAELRSEVRDFRPQASMKVDFGETGVRRGEEGDVDTKAEVPNPRTEDEWLTFLDAAWYAAGRVKTSQAAMDRKEVILARAIAALPLSPPDPAKPAQAIVDRDELWRRISLALEDETLNPRDLATEAAMNYFSEIHLAPAKPTVSAVPNARDCHAAYARHAGINAFDECRDETRAGFYAIESLVRSRVVEANPAMVQNMPSREAAIAAIDYADQHSPNRLNSEMAADAVLELFKPDPAMVTVRRDDLWEILTHVDFLQRNGPTYANRSAVAVAIERLDALAPPKEKECEHRNLKFDVSDLNIPLKCEDCGMVRRLGPWEPGDANADQK